MTAIFLAAMIFIVEAVHRRDDLDDPLYEEFLSQSKARWAFSTAVWLVIGTAALFLVGPAAGWWGDVNGPRGDFLGGLSLIFAALTVLLFLFRALHVLRPEAFQRLRREVTLDQVRRGARAYVAASRTIGGQAGRMVWGVSDAEGRANRAIDSIVEQTHRAIVEGRMVDILEGVNVIEEACSELLKELDGLSFELPEVGEGKEDSWPTHNSVLAGMNRLTTVADLQSHSGALQLIWESARPTEDALTIESYRLEKVIKDGNVLFAQVMMECLLEQADGGQARTGTSPNLVTSKARDMLTRATWDLYSVTPKDSTDPRRIRMATCLMYAYHEYATVCLRHGNVNGCRFALEFLFENILVEYKPPQQYETIEIQTLRLPAKVRMRARQAALGLVGFAVASNDYPLLDVAYSRFGELDQHLFDLSCLQADSKDGYGAHRRIFWSRMSMPGAALGTPYSEAVHEQATEIVVLGYMWLAAIALRRDGRRGSWEEMPSEYREVWKKFGERLVNAVHSCERGYRAETQQWCARTFGVQP